MQSGYTYRSADGRQYIEADTLSEMKHRLKEYRPCTTRFHARDAGHQSQGGKAWHVLSTSPYIVGPIYEGILRGYTD